MLIGSFPGKDCRMLTLIHSYAGNSHSFHPPKPVSTPRLHCRPRHHLPLVRLRPGFRPCLVVYVKEIDWFDGLISCMITSDPWVASLPPTYDSRLGYCLADILTRVNRDTGWIMTGIALSFDCQCEARSRFINPL